VDVLDPASVDAALADLAWARDGAAIVKSWRGHDFAAALRYVNGVGALAEHMDHHPDIEIHWNEVVLRLWTHTAGGVTQLDLELARRIDALA
jgi:4a-hydroxytetrahydrobiopterin dehydratase